MSSFYYYFIITIFFLQESYAFYKRPTQVESLDLATNQLSTSLETTQSKLEKLNETVTNNTQEVRVNNSIKIE